MRGFLFVATVVTVALIAQPAWPYPGSPGPHTGSEPARPVTSVGARGGLSAHAGVAAIDKVRDRNNRMEVTPAGAPDYEAWAQAKNWSSRFTAFLRDVVGAARHRLNAPRTNGFLGGIDVVREEVTYQQVNRKGTDSDIFMKNLNGQSRFKFPAPVNTRNWEWSPSNSGPWLMFGRLNPNTGMRFVYAWNMETMGAPVRLAKGRGVFPGQVNAGYATWTRCARRPGCDVFLQDLDGGTPKEQISNPNDKAQYGPGVDADGGVYYARSGPRCGQNVRLMYRPLGGVPLQLDALPSGVDMAEVFVFRNAAATQDHVRFERYRCTRSFPVGIYEHLRDII